MVQPADGPRPLWLGFGIDPLDQVGDAQPSFDPAQSRLPATREGWPLFYPLLVAHILFGSVALLAGVLQIWPWFRGAIPVLYSPPAGRHAGWDRFWLSPSVGHFAVLEVPERVVGDLRTFFAPVR